MRQILLQNATTILLQNATEVYYKMHQVFIAKCDSSITKCDSYYKLRQFYYKMRQLLQNKTFITNCNSTQPKEDFHPDIAMFNFSYLVLAKNRSSCCLTIHTRRGWNTSPGFITFLILTFIQQSFLYCYSIILSRQKEL